MIGFASLSEIPMSSYLDIYLSGKAVDFVLQTNFSNSFIVYISVDTSLVLEVAYV